jgi:hypothetical protein
MRDRDVQDAANRLMAVVPLHGMGLGDDLADQFYEDIDTVARALVLAWAEADGLRALAEEAYGSLIHELEQMEREAAEQGRDVWDRTLMAGGHFRVHDIRDARAALAGGHPKRRHREQ